MPMSQLFRLTRPHGIKFAAALLMAVCGSPTLTAAAEFPLRYSLNGDAAGDFGVVRVTEDPSGSLTFDVSLNSETLGQSADLHRLYFNLSGSPAGLSGVTDDDYVTPYEVVLKPSVAGGAGMKFDYAVDFGRGAGPKGNGTLQHATFRLRASGMALSTGDLLRESRTKVGTVVHVAVHVQNGERSTIGGAWVADEEPDPPEAEELPDAPPDDDPCSVFTCLTNEP